MLIMYRACFCYLLCSINSIFSETIGTFVIKFTINVQETLKIKSTAIPDFPIGI